MGDNNTIVQLFEQIGNMKAEISETKANTANIITAIVEIKSDLRNGRAADNKRIDTHLQNHDRRLSVVESKILGWKERIIGFCVANSLTFGGLVFVCKLMGVIH